MTQLTRRSVESNGPRTRVLLVRRPIRSVQSSDQSNTLPVRLALGVIASVGGIVLLWFLGLLGLHFGTNIVLGSVPIRAPLPEALLIGVLILMEAPWSIFEVALREPLWFLTAFLMIAIPGGAIAAARKPTPGGPRPHQLTIVIAYLGAIIAVLYAIAAVAWTLSPVRAGFITTMPMEANGVQQWADQMRFVAGFDLLVLVAAVLWVVLAGRLMIPLWLRSITVTAVLGGAILLAAAVAMTSGAVVQATVARPVVALHMADARSTDEVAAEHTADALMLGNSSHHVLILEQVDHDDGRQMRMHASSERLSIVGEATLIDFLKRGRGSEESQP